MCEKTPAPLLTATRHKCRSSPLRRRNKSSFPLSWATVVYDSSVILPGQARFPFKRNRLRCVRCVNENRKKCKRLRWQAANHGCHCFKRAFLLAGACVCCVNYANASACVSCGFRKRLRLNGNRASDVRLDHIRALRYF